MKGIKKLIDLLKQHHLLLLECYCLEGYLRYIKVIHTSGILFMIHISKEFQLTVDTSSITIRQVNVLDTSHHPPPKVDEYVSITLEDGKRYVQNAKELLGSQYNHTIVLQHSKVVESLEQMKRMKACFRETFFKLFMEVDHYLICLTSKHEIEMYSSERAAETTFYVSCELEYIYKNIQHIFGHVQTVQTKLFAILDHIQQRNCTDVKERLVDDFLHVNQRCQHSKDRIKETLAEAAKLLKTTFDKEKELQSELSQLVSVNSSHPFRDMDRLGKKRMVEQELRKLGEIKKTVLDKIVGMDCAVKHIYLQIDNLDYQVYLALMEMRNQLEKLLER
jgi:hypothetical protein